MSALFIVVGGLGILSAVAGYGIAAKSNREIVFVLAFGVTFLLGATLWFRFLRAPDARRVGETDERSGPRWSWTRVVTTVVLTTSFVYLAEDPLGFALLIGSSSGFMSSFPLLLLLLPVLRLVRSTVHGAASRH